jgi:hypothetical protein
LYSELEVEGGEYPITHYLIHYSGTVENKKLHLYESDIEFLCFNRKK